MKETAMRDALVPVLSSSSFLIAWLVVALACIGLVIRDLMRANSGMGRLMKVVWVLTVAYSGPIGLLIYWKTGRQQIVRDTLWRRGWRSTAHCYSGCGMGEIVGLILAVGVLSLATWPTALVTF